MSFDGAENAARTRKRVLLLGATGTIGRATVRALDRQGYDTVCFCRHSTADLTGAEPAAEDSVRFGDVADPTSIREDALRGEHFDAVLSCMASRTGMPRDAWRIDHDAHVAVLDAARDAGIGHMVLLSAICVQKPLLEFQKAKLAFERALIASGITYSIVRPTAFFKSLSGQIDRLKKGKPYLMFGNGALTACKPISDRDLAEYLVGCIDCRERHNKVLPIGGPGPAMTPRDQAEILFRLLDREPAFRRVPIGVLNAIVGVLSLAGQVSARARDKADLARIGRYYATESMLALDAAKGRYDAAATPETGSDTLADFYRRVLNGEEVIVRGDHAVF